MTALERHRDAMTLCAFCPSLCHHACPVATVEARDSVTPWGLMSLARQVDLGHVRLTDEVARIFYHCTGCRACTEACLHGNDVAGAMVAARRDAVAKGQAPWPREHFAHESVREHAWWNRGERARARFRREPSVVLLPGHSGLLTDPSSVEALLALCESCDEGELSCGDASHLFVGHDLWAAGYHKEFVERARQVQASLRSADVIVVMSAEALYTLKHLYPAVGCRIDARLLHTSEYLLPLVTGAPMRRMKDRVAYHDACHLARHLGLVDAPREVLGRVLDRSPIELRLSREQAVCCGGTGCLPHTAPATARGMGEDVVEMALQLGAERLVTFAPECVGLLREAAGDRLRVDDAVSLLAEAVEDIRAI